VKNTGTKKKGSITK